MLKYYPVTLENIRAGRHPASWLGGIAVIVERQLALPIPTSPEDLFFEHADKAEREGEDAEPLEDESEFNEEEDVGELHRAAAGQPPQWLVPYIQR